MIEKANMRSPEVCGLRDKIRRNKLVGKRVSVYLSLDELLKATKQLTYLGNPLFFLIQSVREDLRSTFAKTLMQHLSKMLHVFKISS